MPLTLQRLGRCRSYLVQETVGCGVPGLFPFDKAVASCAIAEVDLDRLGWSSFDRDDLLRRTRERPVSEFRDEWLVESDVGWLHAPWAQARHTTSVRQAAPHTTQPASLPPADQLPSHHLKTAQVAGR